MLFVCAKSVTSCHKQQGPTSLPRCQGGPACVRALMTSAIVSVPFSALDPIVGSGHVQPVEVPQEFRDHSQMFARP